MNVKILTVCFYFLLLLLSLSCSYSNQVQNVNNSSSINTIVENNTENNNLANKTVLQKNPKDRVNFDRKSIELNKNREVWGNQNISNYQYFCKVMGGGFTDAYYPATIKVKDKNNFSVEEIIESEFGSHFHYERVNDFEKVFNFIATELEKDNLVDVKYYKQYGFPQKFQISTGNDGHNYYVVEISKFEIVK